MHPKIKKNRSRNWRTDDSVAYMKKGFELVERMRDEGIFDIGRSARKSPR